MPGGPWAFAFAAGLAASDAFAPMIAGTNGANLRCQAYLSDVSVYTYWNASLYPRSAASTVFSSGTAPLWSFGYLGDNGDTAIVSVVNASARFNGILPASAQCYDYATAKVLRGYPLTTVVDSSQIAASEMPLLTGGSGSGSFRNISMDPRWGPEFEMYVLGQRSSAVSGSDSGWGSGGLYPSWFTVWGSCGVTGAPGAGSETGFDFNSTTGAWNRDWTFSARVPCQAIAHDGSIGPAINGTVPNGTTTRWKVNLDPPITSSVPPAANWTLVPMSAVSVRLNYSGSDVPNPPGGAVCGPGTTSISDCIANSTGWYVVLTDAAGRWLDSYPTLPGGQSWSLPNVELVSGDFFELIVPTELPTNKVFTISGEQGSSLGYSQLFV